MRSGKWLTVAALFVAPLLLDSQSPQSSSGVHAQSIDYRKPVYLKTNSIMCSYDIYMNWFSNSDAVKKDFRTVFSDAPPVEKKAAEIRLNCIVSNGRILVNLLAPQGNGNSSDWQRFSIAKVADNVVVDTPLMETYLSRKEDFENDAQFEAQHDAQEHGPVDERKPMYLKIGSALCPERILEDARNNNGVFRNDFQTVFGETGDARNIAMRKIGCGVWTAHNQINIMTHNKGDKFFRFTFIDPSGYHFNNVMFVAKFEDIEN